MLKSIMGIILLVGFAVVASADPNHPAQIKPAKEFEQLKKLVGEWTATTKNEKGENMDGIVRYRLTSGNTALVEELTPGTEHEMVSVYHTEKNKLAMTHYCAQGNAPKMILKKADGKSLKFENVGAAGLSSANEPHMHGLNLVWKDNDHVNAEWTFYAKGKKQGTTVFELTRK